VNKNQTIFTCGAFALFFIACSIEDPSVSEFDLQKIRFNGDAPFNAYLDEPEHYTQADKQANLFYAISNGDTMEVSICEFENATLAKAFFYTSDSIVEKIEILTESERKRFFRHGRRIFIFSYRFSISQNSSLLDSLFFFTKRFPAADTSTNSNFCHFSLKNTRADEDLSMQQKYFLGIEVPFNMQVRRYRDAEFSWACACSIDKVSEKDWANYKTKWQENFYGSDSTALIGRLSNGIAVAVYGDLDKKRMHDVYREFTALVK
jgi:hypothetical protein